MSDLFENVRYICNFCHFSISTYGYTVEMLPGKINPFGAYIRLFGAYQVNSIVADALAPCVTRSSATMLLIMQDKHGLIFHGECSQPSAPS